MERVGFCFTNALNARLILPLFVMSRTTVLIIYNILLPIFFLIAFPAWLVKMWKRGGYGTGLMERFARFKTVSKKEPKGGVYVHAVSVGEVLIALKLIDGWLKKNPEQGFVLSATTSTGHEIAVQKSPEQVRVIYSPLDFGFLVRAVFNRFEPSQVVLIEAETWPNLLNEARRRDISVSMVNARLSQRSEGRFLKFQSLVAPLFAMVSRYCVQNEGDARRFLNLGIPEGKINVTGSIKFDPTGGAAPQRREEFQRQLDDFGKGRKVVMLASSHAGEEKLIGEAFLKAETDALLVIVPRHAERRTEVVSDLESIGFEVVLRSDYQVPKSPRKACFVADTTGELRDWTAHADLMLIGKSWIGEGGQNPAEAIVAGVPVLCGPHMGNFEPLVTMLREAGAVEMLGEGEISAASIALAIADCLSDGSAAKDMAVQAREVLAVHSHAVEKTIQDLTSGCVAD